MSICILKFSLIIIDLKLLTVICSSDLRKYKKCICKVRMYELTR